MRLLRRQRGTAGGDRRRRVTLKELREIEVAFDQYRESDFPNLRLRQTQAIERSPFRINRRFRRIEVFRRLIGIDRATAEGNDRTGLAADGDHQSVPKAVDDLAALALHDQAALEQHALWESMLQQA